MLKAKYILTLILAISLLGLAGCVYHPPVQQGNIITNEDIASVHRGMTRSAVEAGLGKPVLMNIYHDGRLVYVYTLQPKGRSMQERQLLIYFQSGRVVSYKVFSSPNLKPPT